MADSRKLLRSWKEISAHLGVDERTCARWEQRFGMPVHRAAEGAGRSHVFAYADELDAWFGETFPASGENHDALSDRTDAPAGGGPVRRHIGRVILLAGLVLAAAYAAFQAVHGGWPFAKAGGQPADFHLRGSTLIIVDDGGKELWQRDIKVEGLIDEERYRRFFQVVVKNEQGEALPYIIIKDLDGDGNKEVLFAVRRKTDSFGEGIVICFDVRGNERWRFKAGREMTYGGNELSADYRVHGLVAYDANRDGRQEIYVLSYYYPWEPCQLAVLDCNKGSLQGEFWNAGQLKDIVFADFDGDGRDELFTGGVNNEYTGGCLAVFDPDNIRGASPQGPKYRFKGLDFGSEKYYIVFPRSDASLAGGIPATGLYRLDALSNGRIRALDHLGIPYEFGPGMRCLSIQGEHGFIMKHDELAAMGKVGSTLDDAYYDALRKSLRYWDGTTLVHEPSANLMRGGPVK